MSAWLAPTVFALVSGLGVQARMWRPPELMVSTATRAADFETLLPIASSYLGRPYRMGGVGSPSFDCSGFTCRVYAEAGHALPRVSRDQARAGVPVALDRIRPGDLLFFTAEPETSRITHVGMYFGGRQMIHASSGSGKVVMADLDRRYYQRRLKRARRFLTVTATAAEEAPTPAKELVEHTGSSLLPIIHRLPASIPPPSTGPDLPGAGATSIALRAELLTEDGVLGFTLVPEGTLRIEDWALEIAVAVPIRFEVDETPTVGRLETVGDWLRFIRTLGVGLPGADLELRFTRLGDFTIGGGELIDRLATGSGASGVPALSVGRTPLSFFGAYRGGPVNASLLVDDVADPAVIGGQIAVPFLDGKLTPALSLATDQHGGTDAVRRALNAAAASLSVPVYEDAAWTVGAGAHVAGLFVRSKLGVGGGGHLSLQHRFGGGLSSSLDARLDVMGLGPSYLARPFGPTYLAARAPHVVALAGAGTRFAIGGNLLLRFGKLAFGGGYADAVGGHLLDRRLEAVVQAEDIALGGGRALDVKAAYAARGLPGERDDGAHDVLHASARLRFASWLWAELYVEKGETFEGGGGLTVAWAP